MIFKLLVRHFVTRFFSSESEEREDDGGSGIGPVLALLTIPGALLSITLFPKYSSLMRFFEQPVAFDPMAISVADKYVFLALTMSATGLATVLRWETLFPDLRDYMNLAPLPVSIFRLFAAKFAGLMLYAASVIAATNLISSLIFPAIVMENRGTLTDIARFYASHLLSVAAASAFAFFAVLAVAGLLMSTGRPKRVVQLILIGLFLGNFFLAPMAAPGLREWPMIPTVWFLGMYQELQGHRYEWTEAAASRVLPALACSFVLAAAAWLLRFRSFSSQSAQEAPEAGVPGFLRAFTYHCLDRAVQGYFRRACLRFSVKTLLRSDRHTALIATAFGIGVSVALAFVTAGMLPPFGFAVSISVIMGVRASLGIPAHVKANWLFAVAETEREPDVSGAGRNVLLVSSGAVALLVALPFGWMVWGGARACFYAALVFVCGCLLSEILVKGIRSAPHTAAFMPGRQNPVFALAVVVIGLFAYSFVMARLYVVLLGEPVRMFVFFAMAAVVYTVTRRNWHAETPLARPQAGAFELLRLSE